MDRNQSEDSWSQHNRQNRMIEIPLTQSSISFYIKCILKNPKSSAAIVCQIPWTTAINDKQITYVMDYKVLAMSLKLPSTYWYLDSSWNVMAHGEAREGKWRGNWRMEWVARNMVYAALLPLTHTLRLPVVDWTDAPANLNGLVRFTERWNLVSARVPSHFKRTLPLPLILTRI